jgi:hypothetical protein
LRKRTRISLSRVKSAFSFVACGEFSPRVASVRYNCLESWKHLIPREDSNGNKEGNKEGNEEEVEQRKEVLCEKEQREEEQCAQIHREENNGSQEQHYEEEFFQQEEVEQLERQVFNKEVFLPPQVFSVRGQER